MKAKGPGVAMGKIEMQEDIWDAGSTNFAAAEVVEAGVEVAKAAEIDSGDIVVAVAAFAHDSDDVQTLRIHPGDSHHPKTPPRYPASQPSLESPLPHLRHFLPPHPRPPLCHSLVPLEPEPDPDEFPCPCPSHPRSASASSPGLSRPLHHHHPSSSTFLRNPPNNASIRYWPVILPTCASPHPDTRESCF